MNRYEYPKELYCIQCDQDVGVRIEFRNESVMNDAGMTIDFDYTVAVCPNCGNVLCSRDKDFAFVQAIESFRKGGV